MSRNRSSVLASYLAATSLLVAVLLIGLMPRSAYALPGTPPAAGSTTNVTAPSNATGATSGTAGTTSTTQQQGQTGQQQVAPTTLPMPTAVPTFTNTATNSGVMFARENKHRPVCASSVVAVSGGVGQVDLVALFTNLGVKPVDVAEIYFIPESNDIVDMDDLDDNLDDFKAPLDGLPHVIDLDSGNYHFGVLYFTGDGEYFGIAPVIKGKVLTDLDELASSCTAAVKVDDPDPVAPTQPVTSTATTGTTPVAPVAAAPKKKAPVGGHLQSTVFNEENKRPLAALFVLGLFVLACIGVYGFTQYQKRQRKLATTR